MNQLLTSVITASQPPKPEPTDMRKNEAKYCHTLSIWEYRMNPDPHDGVADNNHAAAAQPSISQPSNGPIIAPCTRDREKGAESVVRLQPNFRSNATTKIPGSESWSRPSGSA